MKISSNYKIKYEVSIALLATIFLFPMIILQAETTIPTTYKDVEIIITKDKDGTEKKKETVITTNDGKQSKEIIETKSKHYVQNKDSGVMGSFTYMNGIGDKSYYSEVGVTPLGTIYAKERANIINKPFGGVTLYACNVSFIKNKFQKSSCEKNKSSFILGATFGINQSSDSKSIAYMGGITLGWVFDNDLLFGITAGGFYDRVKTLPYPYRESFNHPLIPPFTPPSATFTSYEIPTEAKLGFFRGVGFTISKKIELFGEDDETKEDSDKGKANGK